MADLLTNPPTEEEEEGEGEGYRYARDSFPLHSGLTRTPLHLHRLLTHHTCSQFGKESFPSCDQRTACSSKLTYATNSYPTAHNLRRKPMHSNITDMVKTESKISSFSMNLKPWLLLLFLLLAVVLIVAFL